VIVVYLRLLRLWGRCQAKPALANWLSSFPFFLG
jgi:hypothetical protein